MKNKRMKRVMCAAVALALSLAVLTGCGGEKRTDESSGNESRDTEDGAAHTRDKHLNVALF